MSSRVTIAPLPEDALLVRYRDRDGTYTDCYAVTLDRLVGLAKYVKTFYTTPVFKLERFILSALFARPSTDDLARQLAEGETNQFAAWQVEAREADQILLCDFRGTTRSWLMVKAMEDTDQTLLYFGSAVVPRRDAAGQTRPLSSAFRLLLGFHKVYSRVLLASARRKLIG